MWVVGKRPWPRFLAFVVEVKGSCVFLSPGGNQSFAAMYVLCWGTIKMHHGASNARRSFTIPSTAVYTA